MRETLFWKETADIFKTSWESVYRSIKYVVDLCDIANRRLDNVTEIGVDAQGAQAPGHGVLAQCRCQTSSVVRAGAPGKNAAPVLSGVR
jgi:hypothetical protein